MASGGLTTWRIEKKDVFTEEREKERLKTERQREVKIEWEDGREENEGESDEEDEAKRANASAIGGDESEGEGRGRRRQKKKKKKKKRLCFSFLSFWPWFNLLCEADCVGALSTCSPLDRPSKHTPPHPHRHFNTRHLLAAPLIASPP